MASFTKYAQIAALLTTAGAGGAAGYGYMGEDKGIVKRDMVLQVRSQKVWDLLSDPVNTPRWLPKEVLDIDKVESIGPKGIEKLADFFGASDTPTPAPGEANYIFTLRDGSKLKFAVTVEEEEKVRREKIVLKEGQFAKYVTSAEWGFEVERAEESRRETKVTISKKMRYKRPEGVLLELYNRLTGKSDQLNARVFEGIERAARD